MNRPDPIEYAEHLYDAICAANFSPVSFLTFGNAVKDGVPLRNLPRLAAEPFMRIVGEMLELEEEAAEGDGLFDAEVVEPELAPVPVTNGASVSPPVATSAEAPAAAPAELPAAGPSGPAEAVAAEAAPAGESAPAASEVGEPASAGGDKRRNGRRA